MVLLLGRVLVSILWFEFFKIISIMSVLIFFLLKISNILWEKAGLSWCDLFFFFLEIINFFLIDLIRQNQIFISQRDLHLS